MIERIEDRICLHCGDVIRKNRESWKEYKKRKFCNHGCRINHMRGG